MSILLWFVTRESDFCDCTTSRHATCFFAPFVLFPLLKFALMALASAMPGPTTSAALAGVIKCRCSSQAASQLLGNGKRIVVAVLLLPLPAGNASAMQKSHAHPTPCLTVFLRPARGLLLWNGSSRRPGLRRYVQAVFPLLALGRA